MSWDTLSPMDKWKRAMKDPTVLIYRTHNEPFNIPHRHVVREAFQPESTRMFEGTSAECPICTSSSSPTGAGA